MPSKPGLILAGKVSGTGLQIKFFRAGCEAWRVGKGQLNYEK